MNIESLTTALAIWGSIVGTLSLGWHIYRGVTNRGKLQVDCRITRFAVVPVSFLPGGDRPTKPQLAYTVTNVGRRPIFVEHLGGVYEDGRSFEVVPRTTLPRELKPGETISERTEDPVKVLLSDGRIEFLGAWDTTGKIYKVRRRDLQRLKAEAERLRNGSGG